MSSNPTTIKDFNDVLEPNFNPTSKFVYKTVVVVLLYWKDSDLNFKSEADKLDVLFRDTFQYLVLRFEIPSVDSGVALSDKITEVNRGYSTPHSLIIYHYGGKYIHAHVACKMFTNFDFLQQQAMETEMKSGRKELKRLGGKEFGQPKVISRTRRF
jgi:hypothetical protein